MTLEKIQAFMARIQTLFLSTTDGKRPAVRPMSAFIWIEGELWLAASAKSAKVKDLRKNPRVEVCCMARDGSHARIAGACALSRKAADKQRMFDAFEWMKHYFGSATAPDWLVLRITPTRVRFMSMNDLKYEDVTD